MDVEAAATVGAVPNPMAGVETATPSASAAANEHLTPVRPRRRDRSAPRDRTPSTLLVPSHSPPVETDQTFLGMNNPEPPTMGVNKTVELQVAK